MAFQFSFNPLWDTVLPQTGERNNDQQTWCHCQSNSKIASQVSTTFVWRRDASKPISRSWPWSKTTTNQNYELTINKCWTSVIGCKPAISLGVSSNPRYLKPRFQSDPLVMKERVQRHDCEISKKEAGWYVITTRIPPAESGHYCQQLGCNLLFRSRTIQPVRDGREPCSARDKTLEGLSDLISSPLVNTAVDYVPKRWFRE